MSIRCEIPEGADLEAAARAFDEASNFDRLMRGTSEPPRIAFGRLYVYATEAEGVEDPELAEALESDPALRADLRRLVEKTAILRLPRVAAASAGTIMSRDGDGCCIRFQRSRAEPRQSYVIIELDGEAIHDQPSERSQAGGPPLCLRQTTFDPTIHSFLGGGWEIDRRHPSAGA